ncbi:MAG: Type cbb3 cytochrome oxidase biogenesis protein CcoI; Copper-translocating P-type ATPase (EC [uncultured Thiotrichaceae bacterium]|uniref:Type cbb3 cytochrome oxidase biogenesis protein CcoI Copper-translocating P-type ATPase (EC) n=1 Tax=uncultured Thiotrichaceae bacterium TaxID=298394 RepID=A0A6S6TNV0_9GAMM|nr:MAG: Type cbb3 cytochrome oxidase biogenesis protein CcoI; Copper-translocating P-type ATPase (EC [uncultured Thiotrichaceae bacterium]
MADSDVTVAVQGGCFHCGLPVPNGAHYEVVIEDRSRDMCCTGCQAVAQAIVDNGLLDFYRFRTEVSSRPEDLIPEQLLKLQVYDSADLQRSFVRDAGGSVREASLILEGIVCAACVWLNERHVEQLPGVIDFRVNYSTHRASLKWDNDQLKLSDVLKAITDIGYQAHPFDPGRLESLQKKERSAALRRIAVSGLGMMQVMMISLALYMGEYSDMSESMQQLLRWASFIIATPVVFYASKVFFTSAWRDLRRKQAGMDVPVSLAIGTAYAASVWATLSHSGEVYFDSVTMFTFFLLGGRFLEMNARHKAGQVAEELVRLLPATAVRVHNGEQETVSVGELALGDQVLIRPGETVPADGEVTEGQSSVNESLLTGESLPLAKVAGDELIGGTLNIESPLTMRVNKLGDSTVLASIVRLLDRAQTEKPHIARLADRIASWFVVFILLLSAAVFTVWYLREPGEAFWIMLSVLVVTCPCALSLATPAALTAATGLLTSKGVLTTRGHALETLAKVDHLIFDKTGTLSFGHLHAGQIQVLGDKTEAECLQLAAGLEAATEHPVGKAIAVLSDDKAIATDLLAESGRGVQGHYQGQIYRIGTAAFVGEVTGTAVPDESRTSVPLSPRAVSPALPNQALSGAEGQYANNASNGTSKVYLGSEQGWLAMIELSDQLRPEAKQVITELHDMGVNVTLLSGDAVPVVNKVAEALAIPLARGGQLPDDKLAYLQQLQEDGQVVVMVGDGVNDAPVLAGAQVSVAMGSGSQLAQASADMVLLSENLQQLPFAIKTARRMQAVIRQNFAWAIGYNLLAIPLAASGIIPPWVAAIGMSVSSLVVVLNALRLKQ